MSLSRLLSLSALLLPSIYALTSPHPSPTSAADDELGLLNGFTPKPTSVPYLGSLPHDFLFARQAQQPLFTCGFSNGNSASPFVCGTSSGCSFAGAPYSYFGCCQFTGTINTANNQWDGTYGDDCFQVGSCVEYASHSYSSTGAFLSGDNVLCGANAPDCATTYIDGVPGFSGQHTHYDCVGTSASGSVIQLNWSGTTQSVSVNTQTVSQTVSQVESYTHTVIQVSVVQVTVQGRTSSSTVTSTSTRVGTASSSSQSSTSATPSGTAGGQGGAQGLGQSVPIGLAGLAVVAGVAMML